MNASVIQSVLWHNIQVVSLIINIKVQLVSDAGGSEFSTNLLNHGDGKIPDTDGGRYD